MDILKADGFKVSGNETFDEIHVPATCYPRNVHQPLYRFTYDLTRIFTYVLELPSVCYVRKATS